jgi:peptidoglycan hydrolase-like protein with peptidoglycan-binding domain
MRRQPSPEVETGSEARPRTPPRWRRRIPLPWLGWAILGFAAGALSTTYVVSRPTSEDPTPGPVTVRVVEGSLHRELRIPGSATWRPVGVVRSPADGVVTEIAAPSGYWDPGRIALWVDERPMIVLPGRVPAFRDLGPGVRGRDVAELNRFLAERGYLATDETDRYGPATAMAVRALQRDLGVPDTGSLERGSVLFVPEPAFQAPLRWTPEVTLGAPLGRGMPILEILEPAPALSIRIAGPKLAELRVGMAAEVTFASGAQRTLAIVGLATDGDGTRVELGPPTGPLCARPACLDLVSLDAEERLDVRIVLVPETRGPLVPAAALQSDAAGNAFVELAGGERRPVRIVVAADGSAIVDGVGIGEILQLP